MMMKMNNNTILSALGALRLCYVFTVLLSLLSCGNSRPASLSIDCMTRWLTSVSIPASRADSYSQVFAREEIAERALETMTMEQLQEVGITGMGPLSLIHNAAQTGIEVCKFGGSCELANSSFQCSCRAGTSGPFCEELSSCPAGLCENGGTCFWEGSTAHCSCLPGYTGERCHVTVQSPSPAWLSENTFVTMQDNVQRLSTDLESLKQFHRFFLLPEMSALKKQADSIERTLREINGPKFFSRWTSLSEKGVRDFSHLNVGGRGFMVILTSSARTPSSPLLVVYELGHTPSPFSSAPFQIIALSSDASRAVRAFSLSSSAHYIVAVGDTSSAHRWDPATERFVAFQNISSDGALHVEPFSVSSFHFLLFSCSNARENASYLYTYSQQRRRFLLYQRLPTVGAVSATSAQITAGGGGVGGACFVAMSQQQGGSSSSSSSSDGASLSRHSTTVFAWNGTYFNPLQSFHSASAHAFTTSGGGSGSGGGHVFIASGRSVYIYSSSAQRFLPFSSLPSQQNDSTPNNDDGGDSDVDGSHFLAYQDFHVSTEHYLAVSTSHHYHHNHRQGVVIAKDSSGSRRDDDIAVYKLDGTRFVLHQTLEEGAWSEGGGVLSLRGFNDGNVNGGQSVLAVVGNDGVLLWKWVHN